jgi:hypothetical protein
MSEQIHGLALLIEQLLSYLDTLVKLVGVIMVVQVVQFLYIVFIEHPVRWKKQD